MTSLPNTNDGSSDSKKQTLELEQQVAIDSAEASPKIDEAIESLSEQLEALKDERREERFIWIIICVILIDVLWFRNASNPTFPIVILILEAVVLFILAKRMGVDEAQVLFSKFIECAAACNRDPFRGVIGA